MRRVLLSSVGVPLRRTCPATASLGPPLLIVPYNPLSFYALPLPHTTQVKEYRYFDPATRGLDINGMLADLAAAPEGATLSCRVVLSWYVYMQSQPSAQLHRAGLHAAGGCTHTKKQDALVAVAQMYTPPQFLMLYACAM